MNSVRDLQKASRRAFDNMLAVANDNGGTVCEFNERQLVFALGEELARASQRRRRGRPWVAYEYRYLKKGESQNQDRCDIVLWQRQTAVPEGCYTWIEVKSTGLDAYGNWKNALGALGWAEDKRKLYGIHGNLMKAKHRRFWVWLFRFSTYRRELNEAFGVRDRWVQDLELGDLATIVHRDAQRMVLSKALRSIEREAAQSLVSIRPNIAEPIADSPVESLATLIVTAEV